MYVANGVVTDVCDKNIHSLPTTLEKLPIDIACIWYYNRINKMSPTEGGIYGR